MTNLVSSITQPGCNCGYGYDDNGNIASVTLNGKWTGYTYDELGQLIQVNDHSDTRSGENGTTWKYTYDLGGNILKKERFAYADTTNSLETVTYEYGDANWHDKLTAVNGSTIRYDAIGNPLNDGTWTYTWQNGRQLQKMQKSGVTAEFVYNADGLRVQKTVNGVATKYTLHGKNIVHMTSGTDELHFFYDAQNRPAVVVYNGVPYAYVKSLRVQKTVNGVVTKYTLHGKNVVHMTSGTDELHFFYDAQNRPAVVVYNGVPYAYVKSLQGDIVAILDENGNAVVSYGYDAWGAPLWCTGELAETLGKVQPFRYRGYVFDEETGLYYLRSRYYSIRICRFINSDAVLLKTENFAHNGYTYCSNNPIYFLDTSGTCVTCSYCEECGEEHLLFAGEFGDKMEHVQKKNYKNGRMKVCQFMALLEQMRIEEWEYDHDTAYGRVDCVGIYRYTMYWYYSASSVKALKISTHVEGTYRNSVYNKTDPKKNVVGKGKIDANTEFRIGMGLFRNPFGDDGHFAVYVGNYFPGYENAVIESVYGGVIIRELSESEAINDPFTHYGYMKGIDYTN